MYFDTLLRAEHVNQILNYVGGDGLTRNQNGNPGRVRRDLIRTDPAIQLFVQPLLLIQKRHDFSPAIVGVTGQIFEFSKTRNLGDAIEPAGCASFPCNAHKRIVETRYLASRGTYGK